MPGVFPAPSQAGQSKIKALVANCSKGLLKNIGTAISF